MLETVVEIADSLLVIQWDLRRDVPMASAAAVLEHYVVLVEHRVYLVPPVLCGSRHLW